MINWDEMTKIAWLLGEVTREKETKISTKLLTETIVNCSLTHEIKNDIIICTV